MYPVEFGAFNELVLDLHQNLNVERLNEDIYPTESRSTFLKVSNFKNNK